MDKNCSSLRESTGISRVKSPTHSRVTRTRLSSSSCQPPSLVIPPPSPSGSHNPCDTVTEDAVKVYIRVKPIPEDQASCISIAEDGKTLLLHSHEQEKESGPPHMVTVDHVLGVEATQEDVFLSTGLSMVEHCMAGFNASLFAYGQTGSGKTYTLLGEKDGRRGIAPRLFESLFQSIEAAEDSSGGWKYSIKCSFLEIYNEDVADLLDEGTNTKSLAIRDGDAERGVYVQGLSEHAILNVNDALTLISLGAARRRAAATAMNDRSSRSHAVFTATIEARSPVSENGVAQIRSSKINLIDLAGSERVGRSRVSGETLTEAKAINKSLVVLGRVVAALEEAQKKRPGAHIPYRDSRLTFLLQESLGGNARTAIIATITPAPDSYGETYSTLTFAAGAKRVRCRPVVNEGASGTTKALQLENAQLRIELADLQSRLSSMIDTISQEASFQEDQEEESSSSAQVLRERLAFVESLFDQNNSLINSLQEEQAVLRREAAEARCQVRALTEECMSLRGEVSSLTSALEAAGADIECERAKRRAAEVREEVARKSADDGEKKAAEAHVHQEEALEMVEKLQKELEAARQANAGAHASVVRYKRMMSDITRLIDWTQTKNPSTKVIERQETTTTCPSPAAAAALRIARLQLGLAPSSSPLGDATNSV